MATWKERLTEVLGSRGYEPCMRRSIQSVVLYEAQRCVKDKLPSMRPFQRKVAFWDQAMALLGTLDFIPDYQKREIMWRTGTSKEQLEPAVAWKRCKHIERELAKLVEKAKFYIDGNSHEEVCELLVQELYETTAKQEQSGSGVSGDGEVKARPANWIHAHNNVWLTFRLYYKGDQMDPDFPPPVLPKEIVVPQHKPKPGDHSVYVSFSKGASGGSGSQSGDDHGMSQGAVAATTTNGESAAIENRTKALAEVRQHLDLLKEFEDVVPAEELNRRKRELFMALPPAPPPLSSNKKPRM